MNEERWRKTTISLLQKYEMKKAVPSKCLGNLQVGIKSNFKVRT
jgi:hypothetical protein